MAGSALTAITKPLSVGWAAMHAKFANGTLTLTVTNHTPNVEDPLLPGPKTLTTYTFDCLDGKGIEHLTEGAAAGGSTESQGDRITLDLAALEAQGLTFDTFRALSRTAGVAIAMNGDTVELGAITHDEMARVAVMSYQKIEGDA